MPTDDKNRPFLSTKSPGTNDYINAVFVDVSRTVFLHCLSLSVEYVARKLSSE